MSRLDYIYKKFIWGKGEQLRLPTAMSFGCLQGERGKELRIE